MRKWLWFGLIILPAMWLSGCGGSDNTLSLGENSGIIQSDDFDPFGSKGGPLNLRYFTAPKAVTYQVILTSGPDAPALPQPWIMVFVGHVDETNESFFGAYDSGEGVLTQRHGDKIASLTIKARAGREYTICFGGWTGGTGNYSWSIKQL